MKEYKYKGHTFRATETCHISGKPLYEIDGLKDAGRRPFLMSIQDVKDFINTAVDIGYWIDGSGFTHWVAQ